MISLEDGIQLISGGGTVGLAIVVYLELRYVRDEIRALRTALVWIAARQLGEDPPVDPPPPSALPPFFRSL